MSAEKYAHVQRMLRAAHKGTTWSQMSAECGISASTIKKFAYNETGRPQFRTVDLLADYAGFRLEIQHLRLHNQFKLSRVK